MFLPLNRVWSVDRLFNRVPRPQEKTILSGATIAYIAQICFIYIFTGVLKSGLPWHNGTAVYYTLNVNQLVTPFGVWLRAFPFVMTFLTYAVWYMEVYGTILFFSPIATGYVRTLGIVLFALMQIGFNTSMRLGLFGMIMIVTTFGLFPTDFWEKAFTPFCEWLARKGTPGLTIYYDTECTFCAKVSFILKRILFLHPDTRVVAAHTNPAIEKILIEKNSWVITNASGHVYTAWEGVITVIEHSPILSWSSIILQTHYIRLWGNKLYKTIAEKRTQVCAPEPHEKPKTRWSRICTGTLSAILIALIIYVFVWNIDSLGHGKKYITTETAWIGWMLHLDQGWTMFAPAPLTQDGWYVLPGTLRDGTAVDVFDGASPVSWDKPQLIAYTYKNQRWQKYLMNLWGANYAVYRLGYGQYLCRQWNSTHPYDKQLMSFKIIFMVQDTPAPGKVASPVRPTTIWDHHCF